MNSSIAGYWLFFWGAISLALLTKIFRMPVVSDYAVLIIIPIAIVLIVSNVIEYNRYYSVLLKLKPNYASMFAQNVRWVHRGMPNIGFKKYFWNLLKNSSEKELQVIAERERRLIRFNWLVFLMLFPFGYLMLFVL